MGSASSSGIAPLRDAAATVVALDELHDERGHAADLFEAVDGGDVRMIQCREDLRFPLEAREPFGVARERRQAGP